MQKLTILFSLIWLTTQAQVSQLQSLPGAVNVVFLDFDGATVNNPNWYASQIDAASTNWTSTQITECFWRTAEKFTPFNINITTIQNVYDAAAVNRRMRCVLTPTSQWYGSAGGVAFVGSFGYSAYEPCWVFTNMVSNNVKYAADAAAHEIGHTLWLNHHGQYDASCNRTSSYHGGKGTGEVSWCPIMGAAYNTNVAQWYNGTTTTLTCFGNIVDDLQKITTFGSVSYKTDDRANDNAGSLPIGRNNTAVSDSGVIERTGDIDVFKLTSNTAFDLTLTMRTTNLAPMLDCKLELLNSQGNIIAIDSNLTTLQAIFSRTNLSAGTYFIRASGSGHPNFIDYGSTQPTNYGSLGRYWISGTITEKQTETCQKPTFTASTDCKHTTLNILPNTGYTSLTAGYSTDGVNYIYQAVTNNTINYSLGIGVYYFEVIAQCNTLSAGSGAAIHNVTEIKLPAPDFILASNKRRQMTITYVSNNALRWTIRYRIQGTTNWIATFNTTNTTTTRSNLQSGKVYEVQMRSICQTGTGQWSTSKTVTIK